jgi:ArsR family transcriptional regulator
MAASALPLLDSFSALADPIRCRMLWLLDRQELTVGELCAVLQLPQSTVSRHLKTLADAGWVSSRKDGTSRYYTLSAGRLDSGKAELWALTRAQLAGRAGVEQDAHRLTQVLARRSSASREFFAAAAGQWDRLRDELFGSEVALRALVALLPATWTLGDLGCGTGALLPVLAPHVRQVIGVDASEEMLTAARHRTSGLANVELRRGALEALPLADGSLDAAVMMLVLHHLPSPVTVLAEARRVLRVGGRLLVVDMTAHDREEYRQQMGHVWLGFDADQVHRVLAQAGFAGVRVDTLPPAAEAKGPALFVATGEKVPGTEGGAPAR